MKNKVLFFSGSLITIMGSVIFTFATGLFLLETTGKSSVFATNLIIATLPIAIMSPFLGKFIDLVSKKKIIILSDLLNGLLMLLIFFLWKSVNHIHLIYFGTLVSSFLAFFVSLAYEAGIPQLFRDKWLIKANSLSSVIESTSRIIGPLAGSIVYAFIDMRYFIFVNAISFFISAVLEFFLTFEKKIEIKKQNKTRILEGFYYMKKSKNILFITILGLMSNIGIGFCILVPIPYLINNIFLLSKESYGLIMSFSSLGIITGALILNQLKKEIDLQDLFKISYAMSLFSLLFIVPSIFIIHSSYIIVIYSLGMFLFGISIAFIDIPIITFLQKYSPENLRGQIIGIFISFAKIALPISLFISGQIVDSWSPYLSVVLGGIIFLFSGLFLMKFSKKSI
jgi:MFS family permease